MSKEIYLLRRELEEYCSEQIQEDRSKNFHPSSATVCGRSLVYSHNDKQIIRNKLELKQLLTFNIGHYVHYMLQDYFIDCGMCPDLPKYPEWEEKFVKLCEDNFADTPLIQHGKLDHLIKRFRWCVNDRVEAPMALDNINMVGHIDALCIVDGEEVVVDIKTINEGRFTREIASKPVYKDVIQLLLYMYEKARSKGILIYLNKNDQGFRGPGFKEYLIKMSEYSEVVNAKLEWFKDLIGHIKGGTIPERERNKGDKECNHCKYSKVCWNGENTNTVPKFPF